MLSALISFLGGSVFRMIWGELSSWMTTRQDHAHEIERMRLQGELDAAAHTRNQDAIRLQAELGVRTIRVQGEADIGRIEADGWLTAVRGTTTATGVWLVDLWNGVIRPAVATWSIGMISGNYLKWWVLDENGWSVCGAALGIYLADRALFKRGK
ncbi:hypothetical protein GTP46_24480 [Duganella sp. FT135W]|uniref:Uncharacterized protein n=1 Tax=Duganella flavida TaxID=2692175 RepID=A0A6L8KEA2_9BURK|nr:hypothetical protein [Duganella flavida]MYM25789.1 hypothetical protein [Duganella flavida]